MGVRDLMAFDQTQVPHMHVCLGIHLLLSLSGQKTTAHFASCHLCYKSAVVYDVYRIMHRVEK